VLVSVQS